MFIDSCFWLCESYVYVLKKREPLLHGWLSFLFVMNELA